MKKIAVIYHSGYGHTAYYAKHVAEGATATKKAIVDLMSTDEALKKLDSLSQYDGFIWGSPTYMGSVSGPFKSFMDATGGVWMKSGWKDKWSAGFTVSGSPSGDKQSTLNAMVVFAAQHGMFWMSLGHNNETYAGVKHEEAANRLGSSLGAMAQAANEAPEKSIPAGDLKTAKLLGERFANVVSRWN